MIQRIQSIYFLIAAVLLIVFSFSCDFNLLKITEKLFYLFIPAIASIFIAFLTLIIIFLFNNRNFQTVLSSVIILFIITIIGLFIYNFGLKQFYLEWTFYLLPLTILFLFLARLNIKKDEKLLKSVNRLR